MNDGISDLVPIWIRTEDESYGHRIGALPLAAFATANPAEIVGKFRLNIGATGHTAGLGELSGQFFTEAARGAGFEIVVEEDDGSNS